MGPRRTFSSGSGAPARAATSGLRAQARAATSGLRAQARDAGYTLVELMMIVTVIAVSTVVFAPGFTRAMADRRTASVARELIRIGRRARSDSFGYLRAHLIWIQPTQSSSSGRVQLLRGNTNSCLIESWPTIQATCGNPPALPGTNCLEDLRLSDTSWGSGAIALFEEALANNAASYQRTLRALCFAPNGVMYSGTGANITAAASNATLSDQNTVNGGFVYTFHLGSSAPTDTDRVHRVLFPFGTTPRALR